MTVVASGIGSSKVSKVACGNWARWRMGLGLLAVAGIAAACGSGGPPKASGKSSTSTGQTTTSETSAASGLNLVASDFPGPWKKAPTTRGPSVVRDSMNHCLLQAPGAASPSTSSTSSTFIDATNGQEASSQVQLYAASTQAMSAARSAGSRGVSRCLQREVSTALPKTLPSGETLRHVSASGKTVPGLATGESSQRVVALVTYPTGNGGSGGTTVFTDVIGFASGTAFLEAEFESTGSPPPEALERSTMAALQARAAS